MNTPGQQAPTLLASIPPASTPAEAHKLAGGLADTMSALLDVIEIETGLVREGRIAEAMALDPQKSDLARRYVAGISSIKASQPYLTQATPGLLATLHSHHELFRAKLQVNLTVLATAHAVSEGIVRGVNTEMARRAAPSTYTAAGNRSALPARRATPLTLSRSL